MKRPTNIHEIIRLLEERIESMPDEHAKRFVRDMAAKLDKFGDTFNASPKQHGYLWALIEQTFWSTENGKPKSRLEELKDRKAKLLKKQRNHKAQVGWARSADAAGVGVVMRQISEQPVTARMRHDKSISRQLHNAPLLKTGTKRD